MKEWDSVTAIGPKKGKTLKTMKITVVGQLAVISLVLSHSFVLRSEKVCECFERPDRRTMGWFLSRMSDQGQAGS